jgi:hypothetical protein
VTAEARENQQAAAAQSAGEQAAAKHATDALSQHRIAGSTTAVEPAQTADDHSVSWTSTVDASASPTLVPSTPPPTKSFERDKRDRT